MIHVFHGFLGGPKDFSFLESKDVILHDLLGLESPPVLSEEDTLIGYSMGGRIAMELFLSMGHKLKKLVLINAHPGLENLEQRQERKIWEDMTLEKMKDLDATAFMNYWNGLPVFSHDLPISDCSGQKLELAMRLFERYRLSSMPNYLQELLPFKDKVLWIIGEQDTKYLELAKMVLAPKGLKCRLVEGGHRLFQRPEILLDTLRLEGVF